MFECVKFMICCGAGIRMFVYVGMVLNMVLVVLFVRIRLSSLIVVSFLVEVTFRALVVVVPFGTNIILNELVWTDWIVASLSCCL